VDGGKAVAVITQINEGYWRPNGSRMFFGQQIPDGVAHIQVMRTHHSFYDVELRWTTKNAEEHAMPFEQTDEGIIAAFIAMKLTC
jgi:hypothetical protein